MQRFAVTGTNHKFAPIEVREVLAFPDAAQPLALKALREQHGVEQAVILATCNRVEVITFSDHPDVREAVAGFFASHHHVGRDFFGDHLYHHRGAEAVNHVFGVAASLDSMVVGETQILAQLKNAYAMASNEGATGKALNLLMHKAFAVAKEIHTDTSISRGQLSVASVAVSFVKRTFDDLSRKTALLVGAGETGQLTLRHLREAGIGHVVIANRTLESARELAAQFGGDAIPLDLLDDYLPRADIVISQTSAPDIILSKERTARALKARGYRAMFLMDLAVPRDIAPDCGELDGVYRYDVDDLEKVVAQVSEARSREFERGREIVQRRTDEFLASFRVHAVEPLIAEMRDKARKVIDAEVARASTRLTGLTPEQMAVVRELADRIGNKLLHAPTAIIKEEARAGTPIPAADALADAFGANDTQRPHGRVRDDGTGQDTSGVVEGRE